jgi:hypothetical protein
MNKLVVVGAERVGIFWLFHALLSVFTLPDRTWIGHQVVMFA